MMLSAALTVCLAVTTAEPATASLSLRGKTLELRSYGERGHPPVLLASGDGGWVHLAPVSAPILAANGYFVVGLDTKQYLEAFTTDHGTLTPADVSRDFRALVDYVARGASAKPVLVGVSEGAGLAVLAATDPGVKQAVLGVVGLGLPDQNELGWRLRDSLIYLTHKLPAEPSFSVGDVVDRLAPLPLAQLQSRHDEYVPLDEARRLHERAGDPKRVWVIDAENHRFSGKAEEFARLLLEAVEWVTLQTP
jgi:pimeloyl-ACP methyl ester carboxylesterase